ncbi:hypothetical protein DPMN_006059 [Dreissena polymorpha]|uniref:Uncharacterized protein n=1 Tax=Dreissena polymorpha TaxID=45954 RepID=A0A9D4MTE0_DREPO|nr:hypothetical protein DPMN_006059 [Dreissena polymorpha]
MNISQILQVAQENQHSSFWLVTSLSGLTQYLPIALLQQQQQQKQFGTQQNYRLSGELELDAQGQFPSIGVELLGQELRAKLNDHSNLGAPHFPAQGQRLSHLQGRL